MEAQHKTVQVIDLEPGDQISFGFSHRTVLYCVQSKIDPVCLIGFKDNGPQIAKSPDDEVQVLI